MPREKKQTDKSGKPVLPTPDPAAPKMTEEEYRAHPGVNKSTLWELRKSPAHYKYVLDHPNPDTPALKFGRAIHMAILQPDDFSRHYVLAPNVDRRSKSGRELYDQFMQTHAGKELITQDDYDQILGMYDSVWNDPAASALLTGCEYETPLFWVDETTGIECKCRLDAHKAERKIVLNGNKRATAKATIIDLKSCADASTDAFIKDAIRYGYDVQCAHYIRGYKANYDVDSVEWYFLAVEKKPPYAVNVVHAVDAFIDRGTWQLFDLMDKLAECRQTDKWPGYGLHELVLPEWAVIPDGE